MPIRLIFCDLDDTLLSEDLTISAANRAAINRAMESGIRFVAASGRMLLSVERSLAPTGWRVPIIACNGARVVDENRSPLYERLVPLPIAREIVRTVEGKGTYIQAYQGDTYFYREACAESRAYAESSFVDGEAVGDLEGHLRTAPEKLIAIGSVAEMKALVAELQPAYAGRLSIVSSKPIYTEFTHTEANKGLAARHVAGLYGIPASDVLAIGDGNNDRTLIEFAGIGVAVGNASRGLKEAADWIAPDYREDAVAAAIARFCFGG